MSIRRITDGIPNHRQRGSDCTVLMATGLVIPYNVNVSLVTVFNMLRCVMGLR